MPSTVVTAISAVILLVALIIAVPLRNKIREDQAAQRLIDEQAEAEREILRQQWAEEDALLDEEEYGEVDGNGDGDGENEEE